MTTQSRLLRDTRWDGATVGIGGFIFINHPMTLMRELLRNEPKDLRVVFGPAASLEVDVLVAAGAVSEVVTSHVGAEKLATICPVFRTEVESGRVRVWECDEAHWYLALWAQGHGVPYQVTSVGVGSTLPSLNPDIRPITSPFDGSVQLAVSAIPIDLTLLAADAVEPVTRSAVYDSDPYGDVALAQAAERLIIQGEREVDLAWLAEHPSRTDITHADEVCVVPGGSRPFGRGVSTAPDWHELQHLVEAGRAWRAGDRKPMMVYIDDFLYGTPQAASELSEAHR